MGGMGIHAAAAAADHEVVGERHVTAVSPGGGARMTTGGWSGGAVATAAAGTPQQALAGREKGGVTVIVGQVVQGPETVCVPHSARLHVWSGHSNQIAMTQRSATAAVGGAEAAAAAAAAEGGRRSLEEGSTFGGVAAAAVVAGVMLMVTLQGGVSEGVAMAAARVTTAVPRVPRRPLLSEQTAVAPAAAVLTGEMGVV